VTHGCLQTRPLIVEIFEGSQVFLSTIVSDSYYQSFLPVQSYHDKLKKKNLLVIMRKVTSKYDKNKTTK